MKRLAGLCAALLFGLAAPAMAQETDYETALLEAVPLDAEDLAEQGIVAAYNQIDPVLQSMGVDPAPLNESVDPASGRYSIDYAGRTILVADTGMSEAEAQGNAAALFFEIINGQLGGTGVHFYAVGHGNDLVGVFLSPAAFEAARARLAPRDRPYVPDRTPPWFGMAHGPKE